MKMASKAEEYSYEAECSREECLKSQTTQGNVSDDNKVIGSKTKHKCNKRLPVGIAMSTKMSSGGKGYTQETECSVEC